VAHTLRAVLHDHQAVSRNAKRSRQGSERSAGATSTKHAPWYVIPADDKLNARLIVSGIVRESIEALKMSYPKVSSARRRDLRALRRQLAE
jgi:hypothetical protein